MTENPENLLMFSKAMMQQEAGLPILGMYNFTTLKDDVVAEPERALIVDIGGGRGQALIAIAKETENAWGTGAKMILQDRPPVLDSVPQDSIPGVEKMAYDFYDEQPIKSRFAQLPLLSSLTPLLIFMLDAHIYYYRRIMHNYQDNVCQPILKNAVAAMGPTSRLLIGDLVIPAKTEVGEDMSPYWMDMVMIAIGGKERSEKEFAALFDSVGLELVRVYLDDSTHQAVIEGRLKR